MWVSCCCWLRVRVFAEMHAAIYILTFQSHWSLSRRLQFVNTGMYALHPSWLIASLLLTPFKSNCTFLIHLSPPQFPLSVCSRVDGNHEARWSLNLQNEMAPYHFDQRAHTHTKWALILLSVFRGAGGGVIWNRITAKRLLGPHKTADAIRYPEFRSCGRRLNCLFGSWFKKVYSEEPQSAADIEGNVLTALRSLCFAEKTKTSMFANWIAS